MYCFFSFFNSFLEKCYHHHLQSSKASTGFFESLLCAVSKQYPNIMAANGIFWNLALREFLIPKEVERNVNNHKTKGLQTSQPASLTNVQFFLETSNIQRKKQRQQSPPLCLISKRSLSIKEISDHLLPNAKTFISKPMRPLYPLSDLKNSQQPFTQNAHFKGDSRLDPVV